MKINSLSDIPAIRDYLSRIGAEPRSLKTAVVREIAGKYWRDIAIIHFEKNGDVKSSTDEHAPTDLEKAAIAAECATVEWPKMLPLASIVDPPEMMRNAEPHNIFRFRNAEGMIVFVQVRIDTKGQKAYVPWVYFDDHKWRCCEPDGPLPLYNLDKVKENTTVFVHEGPKAARYCQAMVEGETHEAKDALKSHPWGRELGGAAHIGWIGGALSPYRTDWTALKKAGVTRVYIVADNDAPGKAAVPRIAQQLRMATFMIQFTDEFPVSFDLADEFPAKLFGTADSMRVYIGPSFRDCQHPATWATDIIPSPKGKGRPTIVLRDSFKGMWAYVEETDLYVCTEMPEIIRPEAILNKMLAAFSHASETCKLIVKAYTGRSARICYRPDNKGLMVTHRGSSAINLHVPASIKSLHGDPGMWLDFMDYMFVNERERDDAMRWCATLIARPEVRMGYGLLLISEHQGVGKTTLGANILAPLVGVQNVSYPGESDVISPFNDWIAQKRLAIISEIYSGGSWKAYQMLKSAITDKDISVNQKYVRPYIIDNWCHIFASSNSMRALKMESDDRRWLYPEVTEIAWPKEKFLALRDWVANGGLGIIRHWAESYGKYVMPAERAPMTDRKREMVEGSRSEAQREAAAIAQAVIDRTVESSILIKDVVDWCRAHVQGRVFDTDYELRRAMQDCGLHGLKERYKINGRLHYVVINDMLADRLQRVDKHERAEIIRGALVRCNDIMQQEM